MTRLLLTEEVAEHLAASPAFVRAHAAELGGVRLGGHPKGPLRFDPVSIDAWIAGQRIGRDVPAPRRRPGRQRTGGVTLIPLPREAA